VIRHQIVELTDRLNEITKKNDSYDKILGIGIEIDKLIEVIRQEK
jgi:hypothetical protein